MDLNKLKTNINTWFGKLYGDDSKISSKRVVGFNAFLALIVIVIVQLCTAPVMVAGVLVLMPVVPEFMFWGLLTLIGGCFGLNTMENIKALQAKTDVATTIAESDSSEKTNDQAKDVIQADQPK